MGRGKNLLYDQLAGQTDINSHIQQLELDCINLTGKQYFQAIIKEIKNYYPNLPSQINRLTERAIRNYLKDNNLNNPQDISLLNSKLLELLKERPSYLPDHFYLTACLINLNKNQLKEHHPDFNLCKMSVDQVDYLNLLNEQNKLEDVDCAIDLLSEQSKEIVCNSKLREKTEQHNQLLIDNQMIDDNYKLNLKSIAEKINYRNVLFPISYCYHEIKYTQAEIVAKTVRSDEFLELIKEDYYQQTNNRASELQTTLLQKSLILDKNSLELSISFIDTADL
jgi:hypothetical protein